jgi:hypothetical protein
VVVETKSNLQFWNHVSEIGQREILFSLRGVVAKIAFSNTVLNDSSERRARKFPEIPKSETKCHLLQIVTRKTYSRRESPRWPETRNDHFVTYLQI